jgi:hypothetical protein
MEESEVNGWWQLTHQLVHCHRCKGRTSGVSPLQSTTEDMGGDWRMSRLTLCPECLTELRDIIDRADHGNSEANGELERELAKLSVSLEIDEFQ